MLLLTVLVSGAGRPASSDALPEPSAGVLRVAGFDQGGWRTNLGDPFGTWDHDPEDRTQFCRARLVEEPRVGTSGYSLMLDYDVQSPNPAFNGFWMKLPNLPLNRFQALSFSVKGDPERDFTRRIKLELKSKRRSAVYILDGIQSEWVRIRIPLHEFRDIEKIRSAAEFVIVFDDQTVTQPVGTLYLDEVAFESAP